MNSAVKKIKKRIKERAKKGEGERNKHPRRSTSVGSSCCSQVHLPADETWLIAVAIPARRPALARTWRSGFYLTVSSSASFIFIHPRLSPLLVVLHLLLCFLPPGSSLLVLLLSSLLTASYHRFLLLLPPRLLSSASSPSPLLSLPPSLSLFLTAVPAL